MRSRNRSINTRKNGVRIVRSDVRGCSADTGHPFSFRTTVGGAVVRDAFASADGGGRSGFRRCRAGATIFRIAVRNPVEEPGRRYGRRAVPGCMTREADRETAAYRRGVPFRLRMPAEIVRRGTPFRKAALRRDGRIADGPIPSGRENGGRESRYICVTLSRSRKKVW